MSFPPSQHTEYFINTKILLILSSSEVGLYGKLFSYAGALSFDETIR
jgi:hypothetical protein